MTTKVTERGALRCLFVDKNGDECQLPLNHDGGFFNHEVGPERRVVERKFRRMVPGEHLAGWLVKGSQNPADDGIYVEDED